MEYRLHGTSFLLPQEITIRSYSEEVLGANIVLGVKSQSAAYKAIALHSVLFPQLICSYLYLYIFINILFTFILGPPLSALEVQEHCVVEEGEGIQHWGT